MVRIRIGAAWKDDPEVRGALRRARDAAARAAAAREIVDVVAVEVDGIDIAAGRTEGPVVPTTEALVSAVERLFGGQSQAAVAFEEGAVELVLRRRGGSALLSVVSLGRPSRLLARDVEVELAALARATRDAAAALCDDLAELEPAWARDPSARRLLRAASRLARASPAAEGPALPAPERTHRPRRRRDAPSCGFELRDEEGLVLGYRGSGPDLASLLVPGRVTLRGPPGTEMASVQGMPFLLLRDLAAAAGRIAEAVRHGEDRLDVSLALPGRSGSVDLALDLARGTVAAGHRRAVECPPLPLARALLEAAVDFCGAVLARNPRQAANGYLAELHAGASGRLALVREMIAGDVTGPARRVRAPRARRAPRAPLGPGRMKRLGFHHAFEEDLGAPAGEALWMTGDLVVACGADGSAGVDAATGVPRWRAEGAPFAGLAGGTLLLAEGERLFAVDARAGERRWSRTAALPFEGPPRFLAPLGAGLAALGSGPAVAGVELAAGRVAWRFEAPGAARLVASGLSGLLVAGADTGLVYGLDADGRVVWRHRAPGPVLAPPMPWGGACLLVCEGDPEGHLLAIDPATGRRLWDAPLDLAPAGLLVPFSGLLALAGSVAGDAVVAAMEPNGRAVWAAAPSLGDGPLAVGPLRTGIAAKTATGAAAVFDRSGQILWSRPRELAHPPPGNLPPFACRGVLLVPSDEILALDEATGDLLGALPSVAPARLLVGDDLSLFALAADGLLVAARLSTRLSVV